MSGDFPMPKTGHGSLLSYTLGFIASLLLTVAAYFLVSERLFSDGVVLAAIVALALLQTLVQLVFFFHLGREERPYWNALAFLFMVVVIIILLFGSLWIMFNLDDRVMPMEKMELLNQNAI